MYNEQIEALISAALADGMLTEKEKQILFKKAQTMGIDLDEFEMVLDARLVELQKAEKEKAEKSAPKSNKYGDVRKCPVCGALVPALAGACAECGYEFSGLAENLSSQKLSERLIAIEKECESEKQKEFSKFTPTSWDADAKKVEIQSEKERLDRKYKKLLKQRQKTLIETFPIPNTKADLFEFITSLSPKVSEGNHNYLKRAYRVKLDECIIKAKSLFPNDSVLTKIIEEDRKLQEKKKKKNITIVGICFAVVTIIIVVTSILVNNYLLRTNDEKCSAAMLKAISKGNLTKSYKLMTKYEESIYGIDDAIGRLVQAYLDKGDLTNAKKTVDQCMVVYSGYNSDICMPLGYYLIEQGQYEEAEKYMHCYWLSECTDYIYKAALHMCKNGKVQQAEKFYKQKIKQYSQVFDKKPKEKQKFIQMMNDLILSYK